jgi:hypothetical protein
MKKRCSIEGCEKPSRRREMCDTHSVRWYKYGDANYSYKSPEQIAARFWAAVDKTPGHGPQGECWLFIGRLDRDGYGTCKSAERRGRAWKAHRFAYFLINGPIPRGVMILHSCDVRNCVNDKHLRAGTGAENTADMVARNRQVKGEKKHNAKLNDALVKQLRERVAQGEKKMHLAAEVGVSDAALTAACLGRTWKHVE